MRTFINIEFYSSYAPYPFWSSPIEEWDVSRITSMKSLFEDQDECNPEIGKWNVSNVEDFVSDHHIILMYVWQMKHKMNFDTTGSLIGISYKLTFHDVLSLMK